MKGVNCVYVDKRFSEIFDSLDSRPARVPMTRIRVWIHRMTGLRGNSKGMKYVDKGTIGVQVL